MLIALTGAAGAGKDSVANALCAAGFRSTALADALRIEVAEVWGVPISTLTTRSAKELPTPALCAGHGMRVEWLRWCSIKGISLHEPRSPRWVLQQFGSFRRGQAADYWIRHALVWISTQLAQGHADLVVTDCRYADEAQALREHGARIVRVHRPGLQPLAGDTATHESEQHTAIEADGDIHNIGTLADLSAETWRVVAGMRASAHQPTGA